LLRGSENELAADGQGVEEHGDRAALVAREGHADVAPAIAAKKLTGTVTGTVDR